MTTILLLASVCLGAEPARYPWKATLDLGACASCDPAAAAAGRGAWRVPLPPALRSLDDPASGTDLAVVGPNGEAVPFAVARGLGETTPGFLRMRPTEDPEVFLVEVEDRPVDGLTVELGDAPDAATVTVARLDGERLVPVGEPQIVWRNDQGSHETVDLPPTLGPLLVRVRHHGRRFSHPPDIDGLYRPLPSVAPTELRLPVVDWRIEENGWARYTVALPHPLPVRAVVLHATDALFDRAVAVTDEAIEDRWTAPDPSGNIRRFEIGGARVDELRVPPTRALRGDRLVVYVQSQGDRPLDIPEVTVELEGAELLLLDPGPGPFTLFAGAPEGTDAPWDLRVAIPEIARLAGLPVEVTGVGPNPAWVEPEVRTGLVGPGAPAELERQRWFHPVSGAVGLVRVPLGQEVLARCRPDRADLRLVDGEDRQIPFLLRRVPVDRAFEGVVVERAEVGAESRLRVRLPAEGVPVSTVTLTTATPLFSRGVTLSRARGSVLEPLRAWQWLGVDRPARLTLSVEDVVGDEMLVAIDNGSNPPLSVDTVEVTWPSWEVIAWLPEGGARLVYGDRRAVAPSYDLALLRDEVLRRALVTAEVGEAASLTPPGPSAFDRFVLFGGVGVLVAGLLGLTLSLVRRVPEAGAAEGG